MARRNTNGEGSKPAKWQGRWRASITVGYDTSGKQRQRYVYGSTHGECLQKWRELKRQFNSGELTGDAGLTFEAWFARWLKVKAKEVKPRTLEEYEYTSRHFMPRLKRKKLMSIKPLEIQQLQVDIS